MSAARNLILAGFIFVAGCVSAEAGNPDRSDRFGVLDFFYWNHEWNDYQYPDGESIDRAMDAASEAGFGIIRMDLPWSAVEAVRGKWDYTIFDAIVHKAEARGIEIVAMLQYNPDWTGRLWNDPPNPDDFAVYVQKTVSRYRGRIRYWEIWNEPDSPIYWRVQDRMKAYTGLLRTVYPVIKKSDPESLVLIGGLTQHPTASLNMIYRNGGGDSFDIANIHPFQDPLSPGAIDRVEGALKGFRKVMDQNGDSAKPIWITEIGCPGIAAGESSRGWWFGRGAGEKEQEGWVEAIVRRSADWPAQKIFWAFLRDTNHFDNDIDRFGLLRRDWTAKPAYETFKRLLASAERGVS